MKPAILAALALAASGCASMDGQMHSPITGASVHKAYRAAQADGWVRVDEAGGGRCWVRAEALAPINSKALAAPTLQARLDAEAQRVALAATVGKTDAQIASAYNASGIAWAKVGDASLAASLAGLAAWGVAQLNDNGGGSDKAGDNWTENDNHATTTTDRHDPAANVNVSTRDGSPVSITIVNGSGSLAPAE